MKKKIKMSGKTELGRKQTFMKQLLWGDLIRYRPTEQVVKEFTRGRTKEIEVY